MSGIKEPCLIKIEPINQLLESRFGLRVELSDIDHMVEVFEHYEAKRRLMIETMGDYAAMQNPEYAKSFLISEAIRMVIREIAPKRIRRKSKR